MAPARLDWHWHKHTKIKSSTPVVHSMCNSQYHINVKVKVSKPHKAQIQRCAVTDDNRLQTLWHCCTSEVQTTHR